MDYTFFFYYKLSKLNLKDIFHPIKIEYEEPFEYDDVKGKLVKFKNTNLEQIIKIINSNWHKIQINNKKKYEVVNVNIDNIGKVYIIIPKNK